MADLFYYESGYIDEKYFVYTANAEIYISPYIEDGYIEAGYYDDYSSQSGLVCAAEIVTGVTVEASGSWLSESTVSATVYRIQQAESAQNSEFTETAAATNLRGFDSDLNSAFDQTALVGRIQQAEAAFTGAFTPTLTADAFKNHTAILDTVATMTTDSAVNRSANVLLEHIADLNAMAAKTAVTSATMASTTSITVSANTLKPSAADLSSSTSLTSLSGKLKTATAAFTNQTIFTTSRYFGYLRPKVAWSGGNYTQAGTDLGSGITAVAKYGNYALSRGSILGVGKNNSNSNIRNSDWFIGDNQQFSIEFHIYRTANTTLALANSYSQPIITLANNNGSEYWNESPLNGYTNLSWAFGPFYNSGGGELSGKTQWLFRFNTGSGYTDLKSDTVSGFNSLTGLINTDTWYHIAIARGSDGVIRMYSNGSQIGSTNYSGPIVQLVNPNLLRINGFAIQSTGLTSYRSYIDEFVYKVGSNAITTASAAGNNDGYIPQQQVLLHFENTAQDDLTLTASAVSNLSSAAAISVTANPNTKSVTADLDSTATQTIEYTKIKDLSSDLNTEFTQAVNAGKLKGITDTLSSETTLVDGLARIRFGQSTQNALFSPTVAVVATKSGEIVLASEFSAVIDANSFTECPADLNTEFTVTAVARVDYLSSASLSAENTIYANAGKLLETSADIQSQGGFDLTAIAFEGTGLLANMAATMSVSANRLRGIQAQPQGQFTQAADVRANLAVWDIGDYQVFTSGFAFSAETKFATNPPDGGQYLINVTIPKAANVPAFINNSGGIYLWNAQGSDTIFAPVTYLKRVGTNSYDLYQVERQHAYSLPSDTDLLSTDTWRSTGLSTTNINQSTGAITLNLSYDGPKGTQTTGGKISGPHTLRILGNPNYVLITSNWYLNPPANTTTLRNVSYTPTGQQYSLPYPIVASADLISRPFAALQAEAITVVFLTVGLLASAGSMSVQSNKITDTDTTINAVSTVSANAGLQASGESTISATATATATGQRLRLASADLAATATVSCDATRVRYESSALSATATVSAAAVKQTGNTANLESKFTETVSAQRIRFAEPNLDSIATQLIIAWKNATGTVLLESAFAQITTAEKNAVGVITLDSEFTETANTEKIVGFAATLASEFTQETVGDRIQPAGAEMLSEFTQTADTVLSKITGFTADLNAETTVVVAADRFRDVISIEAGLFQLDCANQILRLAQADLNAEATILASPTFIVRITADFQVQGFQLTVGDVINLDPYLTLTIAPESRTVFILPENRIISIESETRVNII